VFDLDIGRQVVVVEKEAPVYICDHDASSRHARPGAIHAAAEHVPLELPLSYRIKGELIAGPNQGIGWKSRRHNASQFNRLRDFR
jgi:hypothetical protein